jgi:cob(I)alamin adenosyltransferase
MSASESPSSPIPTEAPLKPAAPAAGRPKSVVIVNTGDGKGKSSSAFGVMVRGWARGWRVGVVQCIKSGDWNTGEQKAAEELGIEWSAMGDGFTWDSDDLEQTAEIGRQAWATARDKLTSGDYDLLILDELTYLVSFGWVPVADVVAGVRDRAPGTSVVITGRDAPAELIELADTVTEMRKVKHAFDQGISARRGIEF